MKSLSTFLSFFLLAFSFFACSNEIEEQTLRSTSEEIIEKPYISPVMQEIINKVETTTAPIPLQELMPFLEDTTLNIQELFNTAAYDISIQTRVTSNTGEKTTLVEGYDGSQALYTRVQTYIDADLANRLNYSAPGTYYVTCIAAYKTIVETDQIIYTSQKVYDTDAMGINPTTLSDRGYSSELIASNVYTFTTYIWGIANGLTSEYPTTEWLPRWYTGSGHMIWGYEVDFMKKMMWRYQTLTQLIS